MIRRRNFLILGMAIIALFQTGLFAQQTIAVMEHEPIIIEIPPIPETVEKPEDRPTIKVKSFCNNPAFRFEQVTPVKLHAWAPPGTYDLTTRVTIVDWAKRDWNEIDHIRHIVVSPKNPIPVPPPGPTPPQPNPFDPIGTGFRVLFVYEDAEKSRMTEDQLAILTSAQVRQYLTQNCVKGPDGSAEFHFWDDDLDPALHGQIWVAAMERAKSDLAKARQTNSQPLIWALISNGRTGISTPVATVAETMVLLEKYRQ